MNLLINMILCACLGWVMVIRLTWYKIHPWLFRKPFACETCMAGWLALGYCWSGWYTPLYMAGAMVGVMAINKYVR
jgi:hypothetical protein